MKKGRILFVIVLVDKSISSGGGGSDDCDIVNSGYSVSLSCYCVLKHNACNFHPVTTPNPISGSMELVQYGMH